MSAGTLIWIGIVLFAVIARMVKTGEKVRQRGGLPQPQMPQPQAPRPRPQAPQPVPPRPVRRVPVAAPPAAAVPEPQEPAAPTLDLPPLVGMSPVRPSGGRMTAAFAGRGSMIRAIVAAEVIGPPKAFVELDNWSHRHREV
jgi:hypothetical protein